MVPAINHTDKEAHDAGLAPPRASPFCQLSPIETPAWFMGRSPALLGRLLPCAWSSSLVPFLFVCKQWSHLNAKQPLENKRFFIFHSKVKEYPNNLALPKIWEVYRHTFKNRPHLVKSQFSRRSCESLSLRSFLKQLSFCRFYYVFVCFALFDWKLIINILHVPFIFGVLFFLKKLINLV